MGYIKVAYKKILRKLDCNSKLPKGWNSFVEKQEKKHNLIIKSRKNKCYCTNCNHEFISRKKVNEKAKCPNCHNKYLIKRSNLKYYEFKDYLSILDIVNDTFVIRYFELKSCLDAQYNRSFSVVEFAREIPTSNYYSEVFVNERVSRSQCHIYIHHSNYFDPKKWREYTRNYSLIDYSIVFPNNMKKLLKDTEYKYSCIWDIAKHSTYIDLRKFLKDKSALSKLELLCKMKLYNLALSANEFPNQKSFQEFFGVSKDYYKFMKRNNITYVQLKILRLLKEKDISKIRYLEEFTGYAGSTNDLEEISQYISLNRFIKYAKMHHKNVKTYLYKDYLRFAKCLGLDLKNNRYAFPKNLREEHDKLEKQYEIQSNELINKEIIKRGKALSVNIYKNNKFIILPARTLKELQDESKQQNNCVRTYAEKYATGICDIYFMRDVNKKNKSLVTVEVKNNKVVQSRIKNNCRPDEKQIQFLQKWEQNVLKGAA
jgi:hypothetical protein